MTTLEHGRDVLLYYERQKWDYVETYSRRTISGFEAWYRLLSQALREAGYRVHENNYELAKRNPAFPVGLVGTPQSIPGWSLPNPALLGPCLYDNPLLNPTLMDDGRFRSYILTCEWLKAVFEEVYGGKCVLWHAGIPMGDWPDFSDCKKTVDVLVYDKIRWGREKTVQAFLQPVLDHLRAIGRSVEVLRYGSVTHEEYRAMLRAAKTMVFLCEHETQGIAYQEALACNVPILAWDHGWWTDPVWPAFSRFPIRASSVPLFSAQCGEKFTMIGEFPASFDAFWSKRETFRPRKFIASNVSLAKSAERYSELYFVI